MAQPGGAEVPIFPTPFTPSLPSIMSCSRTPHAFGLPQALAKNAGYAPPFLPPLPGPPGGAPSVASP